MMERDYDRVARPAAPVYGTAALRAFLAARGQGANAVEPVQDEAEETIDDYSIDELEEDGFDFDDLYERWLDHQVDLEMGGPG